LAKLKRGSYDRGNQYEAIGHAVEQPSEYKSVLDDLDIRTRPTPCLTPRSGWENCFHRLLTRRLPSEQFEITIGRRYNREKKIQGSNNQYTQAKSEKGQIDTFQTADRHI